MDATTHPLEKLRDGLGQIPEVERVERDRRLVHVESWDWLAALSIMAAVHSYFRLILDSEGLAGGKAIRNLEDLALSRVSRQVALAPAWS